MTQKLTYEELEERVKELEAKQYDHKVWQSDLAAVLTPELLYHMFASIHVPTIVTLVEDGLILYANKKFVELIGYGYHNDIIGKNTTALQSLADPEERDAVMAEIQKKGFVQDKEIKIRRKSGSILTCLLSAQGIEIGEKEYLLATAVDITGRKQAEDELKKYHDQLTVFKQFAEKSNQGMGWADLEGRIVYINTALSRMFGVQKPEDVYGKPVQSTFYPESIEKRLNEVIFPTVLKEGKWQGESEIRTEHGKSLPTYESLFLIRDKDGNPLYYANVLSDITDRKKTEEELIKHRDQLEEMVAERTIGLQKANEELGVEIFERKQVEEALLESEARLKEAQEMGQIGHWEFDLKSQETTWSEQVYKLFERDPSQGPRHFTEAQAFYDLEDRNRMYEKVLRTIETGEIVKIDYKTKLSSGRPACFCSTFHPTKDHEGNITKLRGTVQDITERKLAEEALWESEEKFHDLFYLSPLAVAVSELKTGKLIGVNNKFCELTKYAPEQILGKTTIELGFYSEKDRNQFVNELEASDEVHGLEMEFKLKNESITSLMFAKVVLIAEEISVITIFYDLTERRQAEAALRQSEEKYEQLADLLPQVVFETDKQGILTFTNRHAFDIFGYTEDDLKKGLNILEMIIPKDRNRAFDKIQKIMGGEKSEGTEYTALRKDGGTYPALAYSSPVIREGKTVGIRGILADLSEVKRAHEVLRENEEKLAGLKKMEALGLLAGGVAHDLNNVLSGIVGYPELILMDLPDDSKFRKPIETMQESGHRAAAIVQDLLTMARGVATTKEPLDINALIHNYLNSAEFEKLKQFHPSVTVKTNLDPHLLSTKGSHVHIRKVIMNLVSNASEAIEGGGNVIISTMNRYVGRPIGKYKEVNIGEYAILSVSDDGSGVSSDDLERIFDPFYTKKVMGKSGTGLGLSVVWNVVQDHEGYIDVITDEKGTTFELYLPITKEEVADRGSVVPINDLKGDGESILVVDDVESQREISCRILDTLGYKTFAVSSGEGAIEYLTEHKTDLILLDMIMDPGINGRETYEGIIKIHPKQKAVIVSGFAETNEVKKTQGLGAGQYIKKPLTLERVGLAIKEELEK